MSNLNPACDKASARSQHRSIDRGRGVATDGGTEELTVHERLDAIENRTEAISRKLDAQIEEMHEKVEEIETALQEGDADA